MSTLRDVRAICERSMGRMQAEVLPDRAMAYALAGLWDAVELLTRALDEDDVDPAVRKDLERLVRSLPARLASVEHEGVATAAVTERLAEMLHLSRPPLRLRVVGTRTSRGACGA